MAKICFGVQFNDCMQWHTQMWDISNLILAKVGIQASDNSLMSNNKHRLFRSLNFKQNRLYPIYQVQIALASWISISQFIRFSFLSIHWILLVKLSISNTITDTSINLIQDLQLNWFYAKINMIWGHNSSLKGTCKESCGLSNTADKTPLFDGFGFAVVKQLSGAGNKEPRGAETAEQQLWRRGRKC